MKSEYAQGIACGAALAKTYVEQLPSAQPELAQDLPNACTDAISRQAAIDVVDAVWSVTGDKNVAKVWDQIKDLPSAQPDERMLHESCTDCPLYDKDRHSCPRFNKVIPVTLRELQSAQPEQRWIPCSERLPETNGTYLVSGMWESGRVAVGDCEYTSYDGYFNTAWNFDALAWMPLPEPYREGEQDENR